MNTYVFEIRQGTKSIIRIDAASLPKAMELLAMNTCEMCSEEPFEPLINLVETLGGEHEAAAR
jgi:hypothetical protein